jgi:hypothetical protein
MRSCTLLGGGLVALAVGTFAGAQQATFPVDFRVEPMSRSYRRSLSIGEGQPVVAIGKLSGLEVAFGPGGGGLFIGGRLLNGTPPDGTISYAEGRLGLGGPGLRLEGAFVQRHHAEADTALRYISAGISSFSRIGSSGVTVRFSGAGFIPFKMPADGNRPTTEPSETTTGWGGETAIYYTAPRIPVFVRVGYHIEYFSFKPFQEENSSVSVGLGLWLHGRGPPRK